MKIEKRLFGFWNNRSVYSFTITQSTGAFVEVMELGATWVSGVIPNKNGLLTDVVLGFASLDGYLSDEAYLGRTIGPIANRIANAEFSLNGKQYTMDRNDGVNCNHSGSIGYHNRLFEGVIVEDGVEFLLHDTHENYPSPIQLKVKYSFSTSYSLKIEYFATSSQDTLLNLTNHAYFNLDGGDSVESHQLQINTKQIIETDSSFIPTGRLIDVSGSHFDFTQSKNINLSEMKNSTLLQAGRGFNQCYIFDNEKEENSAVAILVSKKSGIRMIVATSYPALMFYSGGYLSSKLLAKNNRHLKSSMGLCLEAQIHPDAPHHPNFPSIVLRAGEVYSHFVEYRFEVEKIKNSGSD